MQSLKPDVVRMTLRVSHDSGRTWGPLTEVSVGDEAPPPGIPDRCPPCACPRCQESCGAESLKKGVS